MASTSDVQVPAQSPGPLAAGWARLRPGIVPIVAAAGAAAAATMVHLVEPGAPDDPYPPCPWLLLTGTYCPGCGTMRAVAALTHGDMAAAWSYNPLLIVMLPMLAVSWVRSMYRAFGRPRPRTRMAHPALLWLLTGGVLAYWVARNLPLFSFLAPAGIAAPGAAP